MQPFHLLFVSDNRLLADAAGTALSDQLEITSFESIRCGDEHAHLCRTNNEPQLVIIDWEVREVARYGNGPNQPAPVVGVTVLIHLHDIDSPIGECERVDDLEVWDPNLVRPEEAGGRAGARRLSPRG